jgi:hypothetical protein
MLRKVYGGAIGYHNLTFNGICGQKFHIDEDMHPLWFNGGVQQNEANTTDYENTFEFSHYYICTMQKGWAGTMFLMCLQHCAA